MNNKKILCGILAVCMIALSGCTPREQSSEISLTSSESQKALSVEMPKDTLTQQDKEAYNNKYIQPYSIVGFLYESWSNAEELGADKLIKFYEYNVYYDYAAQLEQKDPDQYQAYTGTVPADNVESYVSAYFEVDKSYLRTASNFDPATETYTFPKEFGIGGGPGFELDRVQKDDDNNIWTFVCLDINGRELSVSVKILNEDQFYYVAGN